MTQQTDDHCKAHKKVELTDAEKAKCERDAADNLESAAINLLVQQPFFGTLVCGMKRVPMWSMPTMAVDGVHLFYNPYFTTQLTSKERQGVLCHEVLHLAYTHLHRRKGRRPGKWNAACDYAVNLSVRDTGLELPKFALLSDNYQGMAAEEIYSSLPDKPSQCSDMNQTGDNNCPGCGDDEWDSWDGHYDPALDEDSLTERVVRAYEQTKQHGKIPAGVEALIQQMRNPTIPWDEFLLRRAIDIFQREQYHWERRSIHSGVIAESMGAEAVWIPGMAKEEQRDLAVFIDTSGSCQHALEAFASELNSIRAMATNTYVVTVDCGVHEFIELFPEDDLLSKIKFRGGGGTDFRPPFDEVKKRKIRPELCIFFTDGYGDFPASPPDYPVIWAFTETHQNAPWGDSVVIKGTD